MKLFAIALVVAFSAVPAAQASQFQVVRRATNPEMNAAFQKLARADRPTDCKKVLLVRVLEKTAAQGRSLEKLNADVVSESIHRYVTSFFDGGVRLQSLAGASSSVVESSVETALAGGNFEDEAESLKTKDAFLSLAQDKSLVLYTGTASGNNTSGTVVAVYDLVNEEALSLSLSNFGSDSGCGD